MGQERECTLRLGRRRIEGDALLETAEIIFRPVDGSKRLKFAFAEIRKSVKAVDGELRFDREEGLAVLELGAASVAEKWAERILHPKSRAEKLGVKSGMNVSVLGTFDEEFLTELGDATKNVSSNKVAAGSELIFLAAETSKDLTGVAKTAKSLKGAAGLWVIYPKGRKEITEVGVIETGREAGLKDVKVIGFSATHTGLKFIVPMEKR